MEEIEQEGSKKLIEKYASKVLVWLSNSAYELDKNYLFLPSTVQKLARCLIIIDEGHNMLTHGRSCTQREIYYKNLSYFDGQPQLNRIILNAASCAGVSRHELGIFASEKGSIAGLIKLEKNGSALQISSNRNGILISEALLGTRVEVVNSVCVLVVEKDTIFQLLCDQQFWMRLPCIIVCGKGFPDVCTRRVLNHILRQTRLPCWYLGDYDPFGFQIYLTYKYGSKTWEEGCCMGWLGLKEDDLEDILEEAYMPLTCKDEVLISNLISKGRLKGEPELLAEAQRMLIIKRKCEVEALRTIALDHITKIYLPHRILRSTLSSPSE